VIKNDVSDYISLLVIIAHIIGNLQCMYIFNTWTLKSRGAHLENL